MNYANAFAAQQYSQVQVDSGVAYANPHRLVQMLLENAVDRIAIAKGCMRRDRGAEKAGNISRAMAILDGLRMCLDKETGGEIAQNLDDLYDYMSRRLLQANVSNSPAMLDEVHGLLNEIKSAWDAISGVANEPLTPHAYAHEAGAPAVG